MSVRTKIPFPFLFLCVSSLILNASLAVRVQTQSNAIKALKPLPVVEVGTHLAPLTGTDPAGRAVSIAPRNGRGVVLYIYAPTCHWCQANAANMRAVVDAANTRDFDVYAVSLSPDGAEAFLRSHGVSVPVVLPSDAARNQYGLGGTPQTMVLSADGSLAKSWPGAYRGQIAEQVSEFFHVDLPGLAPLAR